MIAPVIALVTSADGAGEARLDRDNPWPGLSAYDERSHGFFSGRCFEADDLLRRILDEPTTVLFGKSGLGKTSLLHAGVFPGLRAKDLLPVVIRLRVARQAAPLMEQVHQRLLEELRTQGIEHPAPASHETLWEYLHRPGQEFWTPRNRLVRPVFVFDQFEELFTLGREVPAAVDAFRTALGDLVENRIPAALAECADSSRPNEPSLDTRAMPYKVVIALREDFLADLESWRATMPSLRRNRMRLLPMGPDQAHKAIANDRTRHLVSDSLAGKIVTFLCARSAADTNGDSDEAACGSVEPALLSLFCREVNEHRKRERRPAFDEALLERCQGRVVKDFYRNSLADQRDHVRVFIEENLITEHGYRNSYSVKEALDKGAMTARELQTLIDRHLLRNEYHLGAARVELTHDLLTKAVLDERDSRRRMEEVALDRRRRWKLRAFAAACAVLVSALSLLTARAEKARVEANRARDLVSESLEANIKDKDNVSRLQKRTEEQLIELHQTDLERRQALLDAERHAAAAVREKRRANDQAVRARSRELAALAEASLSRDPELAIALALHGLHEADTIEARSALLEAAQYAWPSAVLGKEELGDAPKVLALSPDGTQLAVLAGDRIVTVWDVTSRKPSRVWMRHQATETVASIAFSPDRTLLAVAQLESIELLDTQTGRVAITLPQPTAVKDRRIGFSPDGRWLASTQDDAERRLRLVDYRDPTAKPVDVTTSQASGGFAVLAGGKRIIFVGGDPLNAYEVSERNGTWIESVLDLSRCMRPQSVSPGARFFSATWQARACVFDAITKRPSANREMERVTQDIVWSAGGGAFAELLVAQDGAQDLIAGTLGANRRLKSHIKGGHPITESEKSRYVAVSEQGTRVAVIDEDGDHKLVRVYSVADHKLFLSSFQRDAFAIAEDGSWMAVVRSTDDERPGVVVDIAALDRTFAADHLPRAEVRIPLESMPRRMFASGDSLVVVRPTSPPTSLVFDRSTGQRRVELETENVKTIRSRPAPITRPDSSVSPGGRFELRSTETGQEKLTSVTVLRRAGQSVIRQFTGANLRHRFSGDDRWLAVWSDGLQLLDLERGEMVFRFKPTPAVDEVEFVAGNSLLSIRLEDETTTLIPVERLVLERFARWLAPRELTREETCLHGLGGENCWKEVLSARRVPRQLQPRQQLGKAAITRQ